MRPIRDSLPQLAQGSVRSGQAFGAEVQRGSIPRGQHEVPEGKRVKPSVLQLGDAKEVARRLRHPRAGQDVLAAVHPYVHDAMPGYTLALGDLGLMVWEHVVCASGVDVESL